MLTYMVARLIKLSWFSESYRNIDEGKLMFNLLKIILKKTHNGVYCA